MRSQQGFAAALALLGLGSRCLTGCSSTSSDSVKIGAVIHGLDNPFFVTMQQGMTDAAAQYGVDVNVQAPEGNDDASAQEAVLAQMASEGYDCVIVDPYSATALNTGIGMLTKEGTPVVNLDTPVDESSLAAAGGTITAFIGSDNRAAGEQAGMALAGQLGSSATVGLIAGPEGNVTSNDRIQGASTALGEDQLQGPIPADWDTDKAYTAAKALIDRNPSLGGFFAANDQMAQGVLQAVAESDRTILTVGVDGIQQMLDDVKAGTALGTVAQYPYVMGRLGVEACLVALQGDTVQQRVASPIVLVTADNVDSVIAAQPEPPVAYDDPYAELIAK